MRVEGEEEKVDAAQGLLRSVAEAAAAAAMAAWRWRSMWTVACGRACGAEGGWMSQFEWEEIKMRFTAGHQVVAMNSSRRWCWDARGTSYPQATKATDYAFMYIPQDDEAAWTATRGCSQASRLHAALKPYRQQQINNLPSPLDLDTPFS